MSDARRYNCVSFDSIDNAPGYWCVSFDSIDNAPGYSCVSFDNIDNAPRYYCVKHLRIKIIGLANTYFTIWIVKIMRLAITKLRFGLLR